MVRFTGIFIYYFINLKTKMGLDSVKYKIYLFLRIQ